VKSIKGCDGVQNIIQRHATTLPLVSFEEDVFQGWLLQSGVERSYWKSTGANMLPAWIASFPLQLCWRDEVFVVFYLATPTLL